MVKISLFSQMLSLIPRDKFDRLVSKHASDKHQKGINSWTHLVAMLFCHIGGAASVRDISNGLTSTTGNLSHLGVDRVPCKSSLSYINKSRTPELFKAVYTMLFEHLDSPYKFTRSGLSRLKRKVFLVDGSIIPLCLKVFNWASYRSQKGAIKLHTVLDYDGLLPVFVKLTDAKTHEITVAKEMSFPKGSVVVVDRGYLDFSWLKVLDSSGCFFVTRAKSNMAYKVKEQYDVEREVLEDEDVHLTAYASRKEYGSLLNRPDGMAEQPVLQANNWTPRGPTTYKVWLDFRNTHKNRVEMMDAPFYKLKKNVLDRCVVTSIDTSSFRRNKSLY